MILVDANLLVYAWDEDFPQHKQARAWLDGRLSGTAAVGLPWASLVAFLRLVTNPRVFERPAGVAEAWAQVTSWLSAGPVWLPGPTPRHPEVLGALLAGGGIKGDLIPDAHLAALALEHGLIVASTDNDFARFPNVRWENPLAA